MAQQPGVRDLFSIQTACYGPTLRQDIISHNVQGLRHSKCVPDQSGIWVYHEVEMALQGMPPSSCRFLLNHRSRQCSNFNSSKTVKAKAKSAALIPRFRPVLANRTIDLPERWHRSKTARVLHESTHAPRPSPSPPLLLPVIRFRTAVQAPTSTTPYRIVPHGEESGEAGRLQLFIPQRGALRSAECGNREPQVPESVFPDHLDFLIGMLMFR